MKELFMIFSWKSAKNLLPLYAINYTNIHYDKSNITQGLQRTGNAQNH